MYGAERGHRYSTVLVRDIHQESRTSVSCSSNGGSIHRVLMEMKSLEIKVVTGRDFYRTKGFPVFPWYQSKFPLNISTINNYFLIPRTLNNERRKIFFRHETRKKRNNREYRIASCRLFFFLIKFTIMVSFKQSRESIVPYPELLVSVFQAVG